MNGRSSLLLSPFSISCSLMNDEMYRLKYWSVLVVGNDGLQQSAKLLKACLLKGKRRDVLVSTHSRNQQREFSQVKSNVISTPPYRIICYVDESERQIDWLPISWQSLIMPKVLGTFPLRAGIGKKCKVIAFPHPESHLRTGDGPDISLFGAHLPHSF